MPHFPLFLTNFLHVWLHIEKYNSQIWCRICLFLHYDFVRLDKASCPEAKADFSLWINSFEIAYLEKLQNENYFKWNLQD
jgi:hypothetical protein